MPGDLKELYNKLDGSPEKQDRLNEAELGAALVAPWLRVRAYANRYTNSLNIDALSESGQMNSVVKYTGVGTEGLNIWVSQIISLLYPGDIDWTRAGINKAEREAILEQGIFDSEDELDDVLQDTSDRMFEEMADDQFYSEMGAFHERLAIEGTGLIHLFTREDGTEGVRHIPLRNFCVVRHNGDLIRCVIRDEILADDGEKRELFTEIDYRKGEVWQLETGGRRKNAVKVNDNPNNYVVVTTKRTTLDDYPVSYITTLLGDLQLHNSYTKSLDVAAIVAGKMMIGNDQTKSGISSHDLATVRTGEVVDAQVIDGRVEGIGVISFDRKMNDWQLVRELANEVESRLVRAFGGTLSQLVDQYTQPRTAHEIQLLAQQLDALASGILRHLQSEEQQKVAQAYLDRVIRKNGDDPKRSAVKPIIIAGSTQIKKLQGITKLLQAIDIMLNRFPGFGQQYMKPRELWRRIENGLSLDADDILLSEEERQAIAEQYIAAQQEQEMIREQQLQRYRQQQLAEQGGQAI